MRNKLQIFIILSLLSLSLTQDFLQDTDELSKKEIHQQNKEEKREEKEIKKEEKKEEKEQKKQNEEELGGNTCGGNCPSATCPSCLCGTTKNVVSINSYCSQKNWNQSCCQCIVSHESGGNTNALNYNTNASYDVGLFQINQMNWSSCSGGSAPCNPTTNLNCAYKVWQWGGNSFKLWSTAKGCGCA